MNEKIDDTQEPWPELQQLVLIETLELNKSIKSAEDMRDYFERIAAPTYGSKLP